MIIPPLVQAGLDKISEKVQRFDHKQVSCGYYCFAVGLTGVCSV